MGLENHVDEVLKRSNIKRRLYCWDNGLKLEASTTRVEEVAKKIMWVLDMSGEFGPTRYNEKTGKIEFGVFFDFFSGDAEEYREYRRDFRNGQVD